MGCPHVVQIVCKPVVLDWTEEIFDAVANNDVAYVQECLERGQDPNCVILDSLLCAAIEQGSLPIVRLLVKGGANVNFVPPGRLGPLHAAIVHGLESCARCLLRSRADPNLFDKSPECNAPLHYAAVYGDLQLSSLLLTWGGDPLLNNLQHQCPFTLAPPGPVVAECLEHCFLFVGGSVVVQRHLNIIASFGCPVSLWQTSKRFWEERACWDLLGGSASQAGSEGALQDVKAPRTVVQANKEAARRRKMQRLVTWKLDGMEVPVRGDGADALVPCNYEFFVPCQDITTLSWLHPHARDCQMRFEPDNHEYFVCGVKTQGSVTAMIHSFARKFDPDTAIQMMRGGANWPRPNYLRATMTEAALKRVRQVDPELLLALFESPRNDPWICRRVQSLRGAFPDFTDILTLTEAQIKRKWEINALQASACGTYMHYLFEAHMNGYAIPQCSPEFVMLKQFLAGMQGWRAYRTEWVIFGDEENIAGSIDLCAQNESGELALIDWKRSAGLEKKYVSPFTMLPPVAHLPDCAGSHYRLQLNAYRYILEKYYGHTVSKMLVVGTHPDRQLEPFIDEVPRMERDTDALMKIWRDKRADACGGAADAHVDLEICSAVNADLILRCQLSADEARAKSLAAIVRTQVSQVCNVPFFGIQIVNGLTCVNDANSWEECGCPNPVSIIKKPYSLAWTEELFAAIQQKQMFQIRRILMQGQDPNCVCETTALIHAVIHNNPDAVEILLQAGADYDVIPAGQLHAASHLAAIQRTPACLELLLLAQADPNLRDQGGTSAPCSLHFYRTARPDG
eukprot:Skav234041  [mRNA]  locus=scaffold461:3439:5826:+ [translate_table: standard]